MLAAGQEVESRKGCAFNTDVLGPGAVASQRSVSPRGRVGDSDGPCFLDGASLPGLPPLAPLPASVGLSPCPGGWSTCVCSPHGLLPSRLLCPWDFPGKNTGVGCHFLLLGIFLAPGLNPLLHTAGGFLLLSHQGKSACTQLLLMNLSGPRLQPALLVLLLLGGDPSDISVRPHPHRGSSQKGQPSSLRMTTPSSPPAFRLETSDGGHEDGAQGDRGNGSGVSEPPPMESQFQGEDRNSSPQIRVNLNFRKAAGAR